MAEVIGILSGAITFLDAGSKLLKFLSAVRNAPRRIETLREDLQGVVSLVTNMKNDLDRLSQGTGTIPLRLIAQTDLDELRHLIQQSDMQATKLSIEFDRAAVSLSMGGMKRSWRAFMAQKSQGQTSENMQALRNLRTSL